MEFRQNCRSVTNTVRRHFVYSDDDDDDTDGRAGAQSKSSRESLDLPSTMHHLHVVYHRRAAATFFSLLTAARVLIFSMLPLVFRFAGISASLTAVLWSTSIVLGVLISSSILAWVPSARKQKVLAHLSLVGGAACVATLVLVFSASSRPAVMQQANVTTTTTTRGEPNFFSSASSSAQPQHRRHLPLRLQRRPNWPRTNPNDSCASLSSSILSSDGRLVGSTATVAWFQTPQRFPAPLRSHSDVAATQTGADGENKMAVEDGGGGGGGAARDHMMMIETAAGVAAGGATGGRPVLLRRNISPTNAYLPAPRRPEDKEETAAGAAAAAAVAKPSEPLSAFLPSGDDQFLRVPPMGRYSRRPQPLNNMVVPIVPNLPFGAASGQLDASRRNPLELETINSNARWSGSDNAAGEIGGRAQEVVGEHPRRRRRRDAPNSYRYLLYNNEDTNHYANANNLYNVNGGSDTNAAPYSFSGGMNAAVAANNNNNDNNNNNNYNDVGKISEPNFYIGRDTNNWSNINNNNDNHGNIIAPAEIAGAAEEQVPVGQTELVKPIKQIVPARVRPLSEELPSVLIGNNETPVGIEETPMGEFPMKSVNTEGRPAVTAGSDTPVAYATNVSHTSATYKAWLKLNEQLQDSATSPLFVTTLIALTCLEVFVGLAQQVSDQLYWTYLHQLNFSEKIGDHVGVVDGAAAIIISKVVFLIWSFRCTIERLVGDASVAFVLSGSALLIVASMVFACFPLPDRKSKTCQIESLSENQISVFGNARAFLMAATLVLLGAAVGADQSFVVWQLVDRGLGLFSVVAWLTMPLLASAVLVDMLRLRRINTIRRFLVAALISVQARFTAYASFAGTSSDRGIILSHSELELNSTSTTPANLSVLEGYFLVAMQVLAPLSTTVLWSAIDSFVQQVSFPVEQVSLRPSMHYAYWGIGFPAGVWIAGVAFDTVGFQATFTTFGLVAGIWSVLLLCATQLLPLQQMVPGSDLRYAKLFDGDEERHEKRPINTFQEVDESDEEIVEFEVPSPIVAAPTAKPANLH